MPKKREVQMDCIGKGGPAGKNPFGLIFSAWLLVPFCQEKGTYSSWILTSWILNFYFFAHPKK